MCETPQSCIHLIDAETQSANYHGILCSVPDIQKKRRK